MDENKYANELACKMLNAISKNPNIEKFCKEEPIECARICLDEMLNLLKSIRHNGGDATDDIALRLQIEPYYRQVEKVKDALNKL